MLKRIPAGVVPRAGGFTIVELIVGLTVGMLVLAGLIVAWGSYVGHSTYLLSSTQLSHDVRATLQVITQDLRRAIYKSSEYPTGTPVRSAILVSADGKCVVFDSNVANVDALALNPLLRSIPSGYRLAGGQLQMWSGNTTAIANCTATTNWDSILEVGASGIETLDFTVSTAGSSCLDFTQASADAATACPAGASQKVELLLISVALEGTARVGVAGSQAFEYSDQVKIRNDSIFE